MDISIHMMSVLALGALAVTVFEYNRYANRRDREWAALERYAGFDAAKSRSLLRSMNGDEIRHGITAEATLLIHRTERLVNRMRAASVADADIELLLSCTDLMPVLMEDVIESISTARDMHVGHEARRLRRKAFFYWDTALSDDVCEWCRDVALWAEVVESWLRLVVVSTDARLGLGTR